MHSFFVSNTRLKLAKGHATGTQHPEAELLLFENYLHSSSTLYHLEMIVHILKNKQKSSCVYIHESIRLNILEMKMKLKKRLHRYGINRPRSKH